MVGVILYKNNNIYNQLENVNYICSLDENLELCPITFHHLIIRLRDSQQSTFSQSKSLNSEEAAQQINDRRNNFVLLLEGGHIFHNFLQNTEFDRIIP